MHGHYPNGIGDALDFYQELDKFLIEKGYKSSREYETISEEASQFFGRAITPSTVSSRLLRMRGLGPIDRSKSKRRVFP